MPEHDCHIQCSLPTLEAWFAVMHASSIIHPRILMTVCALLTCGCYTLSGAEADVSEEDKGHGRHSRQRSVSPDRDRHAGGRHDRIVWQEPGQRHTSNRATEQVSHQRTGSDRPSSTQWAANSAADDEQQPRAGSRATAEHSSRDRAEGGKRLGMFQRALQGVLVPRPDDRDKLWKATSRSGGEEGPSKRRGEEEGRLWSSHNSNRENKRSRRDTRD